jgi:hypothetical protein
MAIASGWWQIFDNGTQGHPFSRKTEEESFQHNHGSSCGYLSPVSMTWSGWEYTREGVSVSRRFVPGFTRYPFTARSEESEAVNGFSQSPKRAVLELTTVQFWVQHRPTPRHTFCTENQVFKFSKWPNKISQISPEGPGLVMRCTVNLVSRCMLGQPVIKRISEQNILTVVNPQNGFYQLAMYMSLSHPISRMKPIVLKWNGESLHCSVNQIPASVRLQRLTRDLFHSQCLEFLPCRYICLRRWLFSEPWFSYSMFGWMWKKLLTWTLGRVEWWANIMWWFRTEPYSVKSERFHCR